MITARCSEYISGLNIAHSSLIGLGVVVPALILDPWYGIENRAWDISQYLEMAYNSKQKFMMLLIRVSTATGLSS